MGTITSTPSGVPSGVTLSVLTFFLGAANVTEMEDKNFSTSKFLVVYAMYSTSIIYSLINDNIVELIEIIAIFVNEDVIFIFFCIYPN